MANTVLSLQTAYSSSYGFLEQQIWRLGSASLTGTSLISVSGSVGTAENLRVYGYASFLGSGYIQTTPKKVISEQGVIDLHDHNILSVIGAKVHSSLSSLAGLGSLSVVSTLTQYGTGNLSGTGRISYPMVLVRPTELYTFIGIFSGSGVDPLRLVYSSAHLVGTGSVSAVADTGGIDVFYGTVSLTGTTTLAVTGSVISKSSSHLRAYGSQLVDSFRVFNSPVSASGLGSILSQGIRNKFSSSDASGLGSILAEGVGGYQSGSSNLRGRGLLQADIEVFFPYTISEYQIATQSFLNEVAPNELDELLSKKTLRKPDVGPSFYLPEPTFEEKSYEQEQEIIAITPLVIKVAEEVIIEAKQAGIKAATVREILETRLRNQTTEASVYLQAIGSPSQESTIRTSLTAPQTEKLTQTLFSSSDDPSLALLPEVIKFEDEMKNLSDSLSTDLLPSLQSSEFSSDPKTGWYYKWMDKELARAKTGKTWLDDILSAGSQCVADNLILAFTAKAQEDMENHEDLITGLTNTKSFLKKLRPLLLLAQLRKKLDWKDLVSKANDCFANSNINFTNQALVRYVTPLLLSVTERLLEEVSEIVSSENQLMSQLLTCILDPITQEIESMENDAISAINSLGQSYGGLQNQRQAMVDLVNKKQGHQNALEMLDSFIETLDKIIYFLNQQTDNPSMIIDQLLSTMEQKLIQKQKNGKVSGTPNEKALKDKFWKNSSDNLARVEYSFNKTSSILGINPILQIEGMDFKGN